MTLRARTSNRSKPGKRRAQHKQIILTRKLMYYLCPLSTRMTRPGLEKYKTDVTHPSESSNRQANLQASLRQILMFRQGNDYPNSRNRSLQVTRDKVIVKLGLDSLRKLAIDSALAQQYGTVQQCTLN